MDSDGHAEISKVKRGEFSVCIAPVKSSLIKAAILVHVERGSPLGAGGQGIVIQDLGRSRFD